jgi:hypothetical protein
VNLTTLELIMACAEADVPGLLWGEPGVGKTTQLEAMFTDAGYVVRVVTGNVRMPEDFGGLPRITEHGVELMPPKFAVELSEAHKGVLVLDELTTSTPAVQAAMLRLVTERHAGDYRLGSNVRIFAIANPPEQAASGWHLAAPLANRFCHIDVGVNAERWIDGMLTGWSVPPVTVKRGSGALGGHTVAGYIQARRGVLAPGLQGMTPAETGKAWPSPRTWDMLGRILPYCATLEIQMLAACGCIGDAHAQEFLTWVRHADLPDPADVIANPKSFQWKDARADRVFALLGSIVAYTKDNPKAWTKAWEALGFCARATSVDVAAHAATLMLRLDIDDEIPYSPMMAFADLITQVRPM